MELAESIRLNLGCGGVIKEGWVNVDLHNPKAGVKADVLELPYPNDHADEVLLNHVIEHISWRKTIDALEEIHRVLKPGGLLTLGYPEWEECVKSFLANKDGRRWSWWIQTLYGSQDAPGQVHMTPIVTSHLIEQLEDVGFTEFDYNLDVCDATLKCHKTNPRPWF